MKYVLLLSGQVFLQTEDHMKTLLEMKTCTYSSDGVQERGAVEEQAWVTEMAEAGQVAGALTPLSAWCQLPAQQRDSEEEDGMSGDGVKLWIQIHTKCFF